MRWRRLAFVVSRRVRERTARLAAVVVTRAVAAGSAGASVSAAEGIRASAPAVRTLVILDGQPWWCPYSP